VSIETAEMTSSPEVAREPIAWHSVTAEDACAQFGVEPSRGLDPAEVERRREQVGPNKLAEAKKEPGSKDVMIRVTAPD
jgi:hypothetical protein